MRIPVTATVDAYGDGNLDVGQAKLVSSTGSIGVDFSANAGATAEAAGTMSGGVEALLATSCTTSGCGTPEASICAFAELQFPDLSLPSYELCGNEIGFNFDLGSVGAEVCWDV